MNPSRFYMPNRISNPVMMRGIYPLPISMGLFQKIANTFRSFNWSKMLSGANKTLNVMNQTIPLIRQTKPMINNVKSIVSLAKAFRQETNTSSNYDNISKKSKNDNYDNQYPTFFIQ